jgi:hypothetical protein
MKTSTNKTRFARQSFSKCGANRGAEPRCATVKANLLPENAALRFLLTDNQVNDATWIGNEKAVEIFSQLLDFIAPGDAVHF